MKTFLKITAGILALFIVIVIALNFYFTDERLKKMVMPYVDDAVGRTVEVESMSLTFFSTFPQPGISIRKMSIPGETESDTLLSLDELIVSVELFSLMGDQINVSEVSLENPRFTYIIYPDTTTNIDFLMATDEAEEDTSAGLAVNIPSFQVTGAQFGYRDETTNTTARVNDLDADIALRYAQLIESTIDLQIGGLSASMEGSDYINNLPVDLRQESTIDLENETLTLEQGELSIRGLALNIAGSISDWSDSLTTELNFTSSSDNFGELLRLVPKDFAEYTEGLETEGSLAIDGSINGALAGNDIPQFDLAIEVNNGYLKNPDLPQAIEQIQLTAQANNDLVNIENITAQAGENSFSATGQLANPLEENGAFSATMDGTVNLATISQFYDISQFDIEKMSGQLTINGEANGNRAAPEEAEFDGIAKLQNGSLKYAGVAKAIENITIDTKASQSAITINNMQLEAAENTFSMQGVINQPLDENQRTVNLNTDLHFDLATIKDFYPIDEDTLEMRGLFTANATLKGNANQIERAVEKGSIRLTDGFIKHKSLGNPLQEITLESNLNGAVFSITNASFETGDNNLSASGTISNYLSEGRTIDLQLNGNADLSQITDYYDLEPAVSELTGLADLNLNITGPVADPAALQFNGTFSAQQINMDGEAMVQPVKELNGKLELSPKSANLNSLNFQLGSSDITLSGALEDYMAYLKSEEDRAVTPHLTGSYNSNLLHLDELIDWEDTTATEPIPIHLPDLTSSVTAEISEMIVTGVTMHNLQAEASTNAEQIKLEQATVQLFDGEAKGAFTWDVPDPERTQISFNGSLDSLQAEAFFKEYPILGEDSKFHEYISGAFSANVDYYSELNVYLEPVMDSSTMDGDFGMTKARLKGHPLQDRLATFLSAKEFRNIALDEWESTYTLKDNVFTIKDLRLTSGNIGAEMNGTQHMIKGDIDYHMKLFLPERFQKGIASVISKQAVAALTQENGTIMVPLRITGTHSDPKVSPDKEAIAPIVKEYLKDKGGNILRNLFDG